MKGYSFFSEYYDELTGNVEYAKRAEYLLSLMEKLNHKPGLTLDLACGTGSLTLELYRRGVDVYGVDASVSMLTQAQAKCGEENAEILFLCQSMQQLDLYGTVDTTVCTLDSLNHLPKLEDVEKTFERVFLFTNPGGYFIFDVNTPYKHEKVLGNNTFVYDMKNVYCVWQNRLRSSLRVDISLDFFERQDRIYTRSSERFSEYAYPIEALRDLLCKIGFQEIQIFDELSFDPPREKSQRLVFAARKPF